MIKTLSITSQNKSAIFVIYFYAIKCIITTKRINETPGKSSRYCVWTTGHWTQLFCSFGDVTDPAEPIIISVVK